MSVRLEITQRNLRNRPRQIMDAVQGGRSFTVTHDGHPIGLLVPLRRRGRFVSRQEFAAMSRTAPASTSTHSAPTRTPRPTLIWTTPVPADRSTYGQGLLDTDIMILRRWVAPEELPE